MATIPYVRITDERTRYGCIDPLESLAVCARAIARMMTDDAERVALLDDLTTTERTDVWRYVTYDDGVDVCHEGVRVYVASNVIVDTYDGFVYVSRGNELARSALNLDTRRAINAYFLIN